MMSASTLATPAAVPAGCSDPVLDVMARLTADPAMLGVAGPVDIAARRVVARTYSRMGWIDVRAGTGTRRLIVKCPAPGPAGADARTRERLRREADVTRRLRVDLSAHGITIPEVVCYLPEVPAIVLEEIEGSSVHDLVQRHARRMRTAGGLHEVEAACAGAGQALRALREATRAAASVRPEEIIAYVDHRLGRLVRASEIDGERRGAVLSALQRTLDQVDPAALVASGVHGDYCPSNVLFGPRGATPIDFAMFHTGSALFDLTRFAHQLQLHALKPTYSHATVARLRQRLLEGFGEPDASRSPLFAVFMLHHVLNHWLGTLKTSASPASNLYNRWVRQHHRRTLAAMVRSRDMLSWNHAS